MAKCTYCKGTGIILTNPAPFGLNPGNRMEERKCPRCGGTGQEKST